MSYLTNSYDKKTKAPDLALYLLNKELEIENDCDQILNNFKNIMSNRHDNSIDLGENLTINDPFLFL